MPEPLDTIPRLPKPVGPLSELVIDLVSSPVQASSADYGMDQVCMDMADHVTDALADDDLHLALYVLYGLHYRSFRGVDTGWEWHPASVSVAAVLEARFNEALEHAVGSPSVEDSSDVGATLFELESSDEGPPLSRRLEFESSADEFREFLIHRSAYQLKEADPHSWAIPRLTGPPKTALLEIQFDEYGSGRPERTHSLLFAKSMSALGLDAREDSHLDRLPGPTLATVNLMTYFGLHRANRGKIVGHLAMFEMGSSRPNRAYGNGLRRLGFGEEATDFFDEHVEADAVHENIAAYDMAGALAKQEPGLADDIIFGASALLLMENRFADNLLKAWEEGRSSLRPPPGNEVTGSPTALPVSKPPVAA